ncbi:glycosyltransferase [Photobacterium sp. 53610]|uniref:glycosyltransferase n=1 Tax=Photobacterium sp. 53610 TaxID=3102789 RepID=UPI002ED9C057
MKIAISAVNVNTGGALVLLNELLSELTKKHIIVDLYIHEKLDLNKIYLSNNVMVKKRRNLFFSLLIFQKYERVLFFGNLPPLNKVKNSILYIHNAYLVKKRTCYKHLNFKQQVKISLLKLYIRFFIHNVSHVACQTESMKKEIISYYNKESLILPFYKELEFKKVEKLYDFCFIGLPSIHKKHDFLFDCLSRLSTLKIPCKVIVTVPNEERYENILNEINVINKRRIVSIENLGLLPFEKIVDVYRASSALIFPSILESFGLPLIEAAMLKLPIFAPNLNYVNDVIGDCNYIDIANVEDTVMKMKDYLFDSSAYKPAYIKANNVFVDMFINGIKYD